LVAAGAAQPVVDAAELGRVLIHFFEDPSVRARSGAAGRQVYLGNQGALARTMAAIAPWLMDNGTEIH